MDQEEKVLEFVAFCIEMYAERRGVSGAAAAELFRREGVLEYLEGNYEALHTQGPGYILSMVDEFMAGEAGGGWSCAGGAARRKADSSRGSISVPHGKGAGIFDVCRKRGGSVTEGVFKDEKAFRALLAVKTGQVCAKIARMEKIAPLEALWRFYSSPVYAELEREETKRWWDSPYALACGWKEEAQQEEARKEKQE